MTLLSIPCLAALLSAMAQDIPEPLQPLKFLVGTWVGEDPTQEYRFEGMHEGKFLKAEYLNRSDGQVRLMSTNIIGYDAEKKRLVSITFGRNGGISRNECVTEKKDAWVFEGRMTSPTSVYEHRTTYTKLDAETFTLRVERKEDGQYTLSGTFIFNRKK